MDIMSTRSEIPCSLEAAFWANNKTQPRLGHELVAQIYFSYMSHRVFGDDDCLMPQFPQPIVDQRLENIRAK